MQNSQWKDHTQTEAETYRGWFIAKEDENQILRHNIRELQEQLQNAYKRIAELIDGDMERKTSDRN